MVSTTATVERRAIDVLPGLNSGDSNPIPPLRRQE